MLSNEELMRIKGDGVVDARKLVYPAPVFAAKTVVDKMQAGQIIEIMTNDQLARYHLPKWAELAGCENLGCVLENTNELYYRILIKKK